MAHTVPTGLGRFVMEFKSFGELEVKYSIIYRLKAEDYNHRKVNYGQRFDSEKIGLKEDLEYDERRFKLKFKDGKTGR